MFGSFWPGPEPLAGAGVSLCGFKQHVPVSFWQMKPCISSVQLRSSQRPVKWAEGLCRITAQLVWGKRLLKGSPVACPIKGQLRLEEGGGREDGNRDREKHSGTCPHRFGATGSRAGARGLSWCPVGIQQRFLLNPLEVPLRGMQANPKVKGHVGEAGCDERYSPPEERKE